MMIDDFVVRAVARAERRRLDDDCRAALLLTDVRYLDRLHVVVRYDVDGTPADAVGHVACHLDRP